MRYAIIAAGEGSRLASEGIAEPKPLVKVAGEPLIDRLVRIFMANDATEVLVVCNGLSPLVEDHLSAIRHQGHVPLRIVVKTTPSSMHSLYALSPLLSAGPFVLTTVDTVFSEAEFSNYVAEFRRLIATGEADGLMGVTSYVDDEKPLYVRASETITAFLDHDASPQYVSAGIYGLTPLSLNTLDACVGRGESRMRNFQRALLADGLRLRAYPFSKVLDIDHAADIRKANQFLGYTDYLTTNFTNTGR